MLELTGLGSLVRGVGLLYWLLAIGCIFLALKLAKGGRLKVLCVAGVVLAFGYLPVTSWIEQSRREAFAREAWAYFKKKCETEAGEKIYKTFTGVKSVLVVKPLPPATEKDLFDQYWMGDPYSNTSTVEREKLHALRLLGRTSVARRTGGEGFEFFEIRDDRSGKAFAEIRKSATSPYWVVTNSAPEQRSNFGVSWNDISSAADRTYWVAASKLQIFDIRTNEVVAERVGFMIEAGFGSRSGQRRPWQSSHSEKNTCPPVSTSGDSDNWFIFRVLQPSMSAINGR